VGKMFKKVLVANRGEIAVRVIKACQELGISTVTIYSEADAMAPHVKLADETKCLGDPTSTESYLNMNKVIDAAREFKAEAIHPGYGFLAENAKFAERCEKEGITFIGPGPKVIRAMGDKIQAKTTMEKANVPVIPGYHGEDQSDATLIKEGKRIGFPLMVKASAGGGGKGMRIVRKENELKDAIEGARRESKSAFSDDTLFIEKYLEEPRHIEFQILADNKGNTIHLYERECSIQRRHQKIIEEAPSTALTPALRKKMGEAAVKAAKAVGYSNAGTVEFMFSKGDFYFLEMNTRLQVEHPITEFTTATDIVKWQLRIAAGQPLTLKQNDIIQRGHSFECRIYAEDPENNFMPSTGLLEELKLPQAVNVRHDIGFDSGQEVTPYYDPMLAKLIVFGENREDAREKMMWALSNYVTMGINTNVSFLKKVMEMKPFIKGDITTHFIDDYLKGWSLTKGGIPDEVLVAVSIFDFLHKKTIDAGGTVQVVGMDEHTPWKSVGSWRIGQGGGG